MLEHKMLSLFGGNMTAYGHDLPGGRGEAVRGPVTPQLVQQHLEGSTGIGIYPMWYQDDQWWVKWGCCDIDTGDWSEAYGLWVALNAMGFTPYIERSRSKGWHVWVFSDGPVNARAMRRALKVAYAAIDLPAREANPKSEDLRPEQLGNYVRLPYKGALTATETPERQTFMKDFSSSNDGTPMSAAEFFETDPLRLAPDTIRYWANKWKEPTRERFNKPAISEEELRKVAVSMDRELFKFLKDGPPGFGDRSEALVAFAFKLKRAGYTPEERYGLLEAADRRWGKYHLRPDGDVYLLDIVERTL